MSKSKPKISDNPLYQLLRDEKVKEFNERILAGETCDLRGCDFRGLDLRELQPNGLDFRNAYFRNADLRGLDFRTTNLEGASINSSKISGTYFPKMLPATEILMSLQHGTRMRYTTNTEN